MKLITKEIRKKLLENGRVRNADPDGNHDFSPVCKFFHPLSAFTALITEMDPEDEDRVFGLFDHGMGFPELGYGSISEMEGAKVLGLATERDLYWNATAPLSAYTEAARKASRILDRLPAA